MCTSDNSAYVYKLDGSSSNRMGLGITLKVMAGDRIDVFGKSYWYQNPTGPPPSNAIPVLDIITGFLGGTTGTGVTSAHGSVTNTQINPGTTNTAVNNFLSNQIAQSNTASGNPKAFVNVIFFDEQFNAVDYKVSMVGNNKVLKNHLQDLQNLIAAKSGFVYIYCSNESPANVFFDNIQVRQQRGAILEETHYYPFGLTMAGISSKAAGGIANKKKFILQELDEDLGLNWYQFKWRNHDPQIGRFIEVDPLSDKYVYNTPYAYAENRVINGFDLEGLEFWPAVLSYASGNSAIGTALMTQWSNNKSGQSKEALNSGARLSSGNSGGETSSHAPAGISSLINTTNKLRDFANVVNAVGDAYRLTFNVASIVPAGEAGAAVAGAEALVRIAGEGGSIALNTEGKAIASEIATNSGVRNSFANQEITIVEAQADVQAFRVFGNKSGETGSYFGFVKPTSSSNAESLYRLKEYGNDASFVTPVTIKKGTQMAIGGVNGGSGAQIYIPSNVQANNVRYLSKLTEILPP